MMRSTSRDPGGRKYTAAGASHIQGMDVRRRGCTRFSNSSARCAPVDTGSILTATPGSRADPRCSYYNSPNGDSVMVGDGC